MKNSQVIRVAVGFGLIAAWAFLIEPNAEKREKAAAAEARQEQAQEARAEEAERLETVIGRSVSSVPSAPLAGSGSGARQESAAGLSDSSKESSNFQFASELLAFTKLKTKVLLTDEAKAQKDKLLHNVDLVKALESLLKSTANDSQAQELQNDAIDLLLEARAAGNPAAEGVLRSVIEDQQVENSSLGSDVRRVLAGVKAEILYQWSAQDPDRADEMQRWLPGPISAKIWANVVDAQNQNELASRDLKY